MSGARKWLCTECDRVSADDALLMAPHPFMADQVITGCPLCREAERLLTACDWPGCAKASSSGTPTPDGYVLRCWDHSPHNPGARLTPTQES